MKKKWYTTKGFFIGLIAASTIAYAAVPHKIAQNEILFGKVTGDKDLIAEEGLGATNPRIYFDSTTNTWKFSNDGIKANAKEIGSWWGRRRWLQYASRREF